MKTTKKYIPCDTQEGQILGLGHAFDDYNEAEKIVSKEPKVTESIRRYAVIEITVNEDNFMIVDGNDINNILDARIFGRRAGYLMPAPTIAMITTLDENGFDIQEFVKWAE